MGVGKTMTDIKEVVKLVNQARKVLELEPIKKLPKGIKDDPEFCPIAIALEHTFEIGVGMMWSSSVYPVEAQEIAKAWGTYVAPSDANKLGWKQQTVILPIELSQWVFDFDSGLEPEYEAEEGE